MAVDSLGNVYVADTGNNRIQMFKPRVANRDQYEAYTAWGIGGDGEGEFNQPCGIAVFGAHVYVADRDNHRIQKFEPVDGTSRLNAQSARRHGKPGHHRGRRRRRRREGSSPAR